MVFNSTPAKSGVTQPATRQFKNNRRSFAIVPKKVNEIQENIVGGSLIYTGLRVAAQMNSAPKDIIHQEWTKQQGGRIVTPFSRPLTRCVLHYEDPTIGYHFSMAYTGLLEDSMLKTDATKVKQMGTCFSLAFEQWQFCTFTKALQESASYLALHCCHGCYGLLPHSSTYTIPQR